MTLILKPSYQEPEVLNRLLQSFILNEEEAACAFLAFDHERLVGLILLETYEEAGYESEEFFPSLQTYESETLLYLKYIHTFERGYLRALIQAVFDQFPRAQLLVGESHAELCPIWESVGAHYNDHAVLEHREALVGFILPTSNTGDAGQKSKKTV